MSLRDKIIDQVKFYFSQEALSKDRFLQYQLHQSNDGKSIKISVLSSFRKLKELTRDPQRIASAMKHCDQFKVSFDNQMLTCLDLPLLDDSFDILTVYCENIPKYLDRFQLEAIFSTIGKVNHVELPTLPDKPGVNKGYGFVEMEKKQLVPLVIETFNTISRQDSENIVADSFNNVSYPVHSSEVINEINEEEKVVSKSNKIVKLVPKSVTQPFTNEELINIGKSFSLRLITKFEWLEKRKEYLLLLKQQTILFHQQKQLISRPDSSPDYTPNILLRFSGVCSGTNRDILLTLFRKIARVEYIDLKRKSDDTHGIIRFQNQVDAETAFEYFKTKYIVQTSIGDATGEEYSEDSNDDPPPCRIILHKLNKKEEELEWDKIIESRKHHRWLQQVPISERFGNMKINSRANSDKTNFRERHKDNKQKVKKNTESKSLSKINNNIVNSLPLIIENKRKDFSDDEYEVYQSKHIKFE